MPSLGCDAPARLSLPGSDAQGDAPAEIGGIRVAVGEDCQFLQRPRRGNPLDQSRRGSRSAFQAHPE